MGTMESLTILGFGFSFHSHNSSKSKRGKSTILPILETTQRAKWTLKGLFSD
jgi:hypothetical protein